MTKFKGKNSIKEASSLFIQREIFKQEAYDSISNTLKNSTVRDFNFADYTLYGRIDENGIITAPDANTPEWRRAEIPAAGGHGNGRSIAESMALMANGGTYKGKRIFN